jgi:Dolichyl-phosphate-mannose-protein mannosyltransferase
MGRGAKPKAPFRSWAAPHSHRAPIFRIIPPMQNGDGNPNSEPFGRPLWLGLALLVAVGFLAVSLWRPTFPGRGPDEMLHLNNHVHFADHFRSDAPLTAWPLQTSLRKPPLPYLASNLATALLPGAWGPLLLSNLLFAFGWLGLVFAIGRREFSGAAGLLGVTALLAMPLFATLASHFGNDLHVAFFVALILWMTINAKRFRHLGWWAAAGLAAGLGLLAKPTLPLYVAGPLMVTAARTLLEAWRAKSASLALVGLLGPALAATLAAGCWLFFFPNVLLVAPELLGDILAGPGRDFPPFFTINGDTAAGDMFFYYGRFVTGAVLAGAVAILFRRRWILLAAFLPPLVLFTVVTEAFSRLMIPVIFIPLLAFGHLPTLLRRETLRTAAIALGAVFFVLLFARHQLDIRAASAATHSLGDPADAGQEIAAHWSAAGVTGRRVLFINRCAFSDMPMYHFALLNLIESPAVDQVFAVDQTGRFPGSTLDTGLRDAWPELDAVLVCDDAAPGAASLAEALALARGDADPAAASFAAALQLTGQFAVNFGFKRPYPVTLWERAADSGP